MNKTISLTIKPTNACNMRCGYCYHAVEGYDTKVLPIEYVKKILCVAALDYSTIKVLLHGGEPTLAGTKFFQELFQYERELSESKKIRFINIVQTNGLLYNEKMYDLFESNDVTVGISFDGPNNDNLREKTNQVFSNIKILQERKINFSILCVESAQTISKLIYTYEWFKKYNLNYKIVPYFSCGSADNSDLDLDYQLYSKKMIELYKYWLSDKNCNIRVNTLEEFTLLFMPKYKLKYSSGCICNRVALNPNGEIYPCGRPYPADFYLCHLNDVTRINDIFLTEGYKKLINLCEKRYSNCKKSCKYFETCHGGCISNSILDGSNEKIYGDSCKKYFALFEAIEQINNKLYDDIQKNGKESLYNPRAVERVKKYDANFKNIQTT